MISLPDQHGETVTIRFVPNVEPTGDPHTDAENQARAETEATEYQIRTRILPGALWEKLVADNPPTDTQKTEGFDYHTTNFPVGLLVESITGWTVTRAGAVLEDEVRKVTVDEARELWETWPQFARRQLFAVLQSQNLYGPALGKGNKRRNVPAATSPATG